MVNVLTSNNKLCTGCGACYNICPISAIDMKSDEQGFLYPVIDKNKCIGCKRCEKVCPKLFPNLTNMIKPDCYAAYAIDSVREVSSSGGAFTVLANWVFKHGGIVCGAAFDSDFSVHHICISDKKDLDILRKSKYVQSNTEHVYREILEFLVQDKWVLFVGTPCQVAGLNNYVEENYREKLILVDFLCGGTPSPKMWKDYLHENFDVSLIKSIDFRPKKDGWKNSATLLLLLFKDGSNVTIPYEQSEYEQGYHRYLSKRQSCTVCEFCGYQRQGDLTIGDFWGIDRYKASLNDGKGISVIYTNNKKGKEIFEQIKEEFVKVEKTPIEASRFNSVIVNRKNHPMKDRFNTLYPKKRFSEAIRQSMQLEHDIAVLGNVTGMNYGSHLTHYALYSCLTDMGYSVTVLNVPKDSYIKANDFPILFAENPYPIWDWCKHYENKIEMKELNNKCKAFITGSDQQFASWLYNNDGKFVTQPFVSNNKRKIAYAASLGHNRVNSSEMERATMSYFLKKFDAVSVREDTAMALFEREFGVKTSQVLDPVFLMSMDRYRELISKAHDLVPDDPYLFTYTLDPSKEKERIITEYAQKYGMNAYAISDNGNNVDWGIDTLIKPKLETWLAYLTNSEFVITDSFHGMCLAIIFHKQFFVIVNKKRGATRFESLLRMIGLEEYAVSSDMEMERLLMNWKPIDYDLVDICIERERERSKQWLISAIEGDGEKKSLDTFDILDLRMDDIEKNFNKRLDEMMRYALEPLTNLYLQESINISDISDIHTYLLVLKKYSYRYIIFISVKDTPGFWINEIIANEINRLGIKTNLANQHWHGYLGVICNGEVLLDKLGDMNENLEEYLDVLGLPIHLVSKCYNTGNISEISICGINYSVNNRGLNFVVWDTKERRVIDSVCYDTHKESVPCSRKE